MKAKSFRQLFERARQDDEYWVHSAVLDFTEELFALMEGHRVNKAELARRLGTSPAYITKILRGDVNFTLRTIAKLGRVFDRLPRLHLAPAETITKWVDVPWQALAARPETEFTDVKIAAEGQETAAATPAQAHPKRRRRAARGRATK